MDIIRTYRLHRLKRCADSVHRAYWRTKRVYLAYAKDSNTYRKAQDDVIRYNELNQGILNRLDNEADARQYREIVGIKLMGVFAEGLLSFNAIAFMAGQYGIDIADDLVFNLILTTLISWCLIHYAQIALRNVMLGRQVRGWSPIKWWFLLISIHLFVLIVAMINIYIAKTGESHAIFGIIAFFVILYQYHVLHLWDRFYDAEVETARRKKIKRLLKARDRLQAKWVRSRQEIDRQFERFSMDAVRLARLYRSAIDRGYVTGIVLPNTLLWVVNNVVLGHSALPYLTDEEGRRVLSPASAAEADITHVFNELHRNGITRRAIPEDLADPAPVQRAQRRAPEPQDDRDPDTQPGGASEAQPNREGVVQEDVASVPFEGMPPDRDW